MKFIVSLLALLMLTGCATSSGVMNAPIEAGLSKSFDAPYEQVKDAALNSTQMIGVRVNDAYEAGYAYQIDFEKGVSLTSNGEIGRVLVFDNDPGSLVRVYSEKRSKYQITGTDNEEFAFMIFMGIEQELAQDAPP